MRAPLSAVALVGVLSGALTCAASLESSDEAPEEPVSYELAALRGYDLPTAVAALIEEIDGRAPAPAFFSDAGVATPGTLQVQVDSRGPAAVVVGLTLSEDGGATALQYRANLTVGGLSLVEGVLPDTALEPETGAVYTSEVPTLLAPIRLDPYTPLRAEVSDLPGEAGGATTHTLAIQVLYGSVAAVDAVMKRFGQARWWSFYAARGGTTETGTLTVQIGGRPTYAKGSNSTAATTSVTLNLDGRSMTPQALTTPQRGRAFLPHIVSRAQVYSWTQATAGAGAGRSWFSWHGPTVGP